MIAGLFLVLPFILYQLWKFVAPGLLEHEKKYTVPFLVGSAGLFTAAGSSFYLVLLLSFIFSSALPKGTSKRNSR
jgi:sec-independent protein translocase protein TatC